MSKLSVYVRAFEHPLIWIAVGILLVNDHVLKAVFPSPLTGKLSDFAGLFFFPFLLAVSMAWMPFRRRFVPARLMRISLVATGIGFAAIKTIPAVNGLVADGLSRVIGIPFQFVLDPTDLIAMVMLWPAWLLWKRMDGLKPRPVPWRLSTIGLLLASAATLATSPCPPISTITRLTSVDGMVYAGGPSSNEWIYASKDGGRSWTYTNEFPLNVAQELSVQRDYPLVLCKPDQPSTCYRVTRQPFVEASNDGGQTWDTAWEIPKGRYRYMEQAASDPGLLGCGKNLDSGAYDLTFTLVGGENVLVVAMGNEGILAYSNATGWERLAVDRQTSPTSFSAKDLREAGNVIFNESLTGTIAGFLSFLGLSIWVWVLAFRNMAVKTDGWVKGIAWAIRPIALAAIWLVVVYVVLIPLVRGDISFLGFVAWPFVLLACILWIWLRVGSRVTNRHLLTLSGVICVIAGLGIVALAKGLFSLWALGTIVYYEVALVLTLIFGFLVIILAVGLILRLITLLYGDLPVEAGRAK